MNETRLWLLAAVAGAPLVCWCSPAIGQDVIDAPSPSKDLDPTVDRTQAPETDEVADDALSEEETARRERSTAEIQKLIQELDLWKSEGARLQMFMPMDGGYSEVQPGSLTEEYIRDEPTVREAFQQMLVARFEREIQILSERRDVIRWTNWISRFIFVVIHVVLFLGLWAAMKEFIDAGRTRKSAPAPITTALTDEKAQAAQAKQNEVTISLQGIALKTSLHGFLILAAAIGFYFLYLKFVYPITVIGG